MVTPSYMLNICEEFIRQGVDARSTSLKIGIFGAEPWTEAMRAQIEQRLDLDAVGIYGLSEVMGPGVACDASQLAPQYLLEVRREGTLDHLSVPVEIDPGVANVESLRDRAARDLHRRIKSYVGVTAAVTVCNPGTLERSVGKAKRVLDRVDFRIRPPPA